MILGTYYSSATISTVDLESLTDPGEVKPMIEDIETVTKWLPVPMEIEELFYEVQACKECRDECVRSVFRAKRAIYYGKKAVRANTEAWRKIERLWPETKAGRWEYLHSVGKIRRVDDVSAG